MAGAGRDLAVGGDATGQFITGDNNNLLSVVVNATHSTVTILGPDQRPEPVRRERIERLPRRGGRLLGRETESAVLLAAVADEEPVGLHGPEGVGKSALLRQAILEVERRDGVVFLNGGGRDVDDLLQSVFEACYDCPGYRPGEGELHRFLAGLRLCLAVDDLDVPERDLVRLMDAIPAGTPLFTSRERLLWGQGSAVALTGLPEEAGLDLLARELGRPLRTSEEATARALWEACQGHPRPLLRAAALASPDAAGGQTRLPTVAEVPTLLRQAVGRVDGPARYALALLAAVPKAHVSAEVLARLVTTEVTAEAVREAVGPVAERGLLTLTEDHVRLDPDVAPSLPADLALDRDQLAEATIRLTEWAAEHRTSAETVADHALLIAELADAVGRAGMPELGVGLVRAAAPVTACSLRWGAWGRLLGRGLAAAQQAGDRRAHAYFTHESGVRLLVTGKRLAAAGAFAAAAAAWKALGDTGGAAIAEHAHGLATPGSASASGSPGHQPLQDAHPDASSGTAGHGSGQNPTDPSRGQTSQPAPDHHAPTAGHAHDPSGDPPSPPSLAGPGGSGGPGGPAGPGGLGGAGGAGGAGGLALKAKVLIGAVLLATGGAGVLVLGQGDGPDTDATVPLHVKVVTDVFEVTEMPGTPEGRCPSDTGRTDCTKVTQVAKGKRGPVAVVPAGPLPKGVRILYWGCDEGPASSSCTVSADSERTVCATTTSPSDAAARQTCQRGKEDARPPQSATALVAVELGATDFKVTVTPDTPGGQPCVRPPFDFTASPSENERLCQFSVPVGTHLTLKAVISGKEPALGRAFNGEPVWFGCDEGPTTSSTLGPDLVGTDEGTLRQTVVNGTKTCTLSLDTGRYIGLASTDISDSGTRALAAAFGQLPRVRIAAGVTSMPSAGAAPLQRVPCSDAGGPQGLECLGTP